MATDSVLASLRAFMDENFLYMRPGFELREDEPLLSSGVIDSMGVMEVIAYLEHEFGVMVEDVDITERNFGTLEAITAYVHRHRRQ